MRKQLITGLALLLLTAGACSWPMSNEQKSELSEAVVKAHLDTLQMWYEQKGRPDEYRRVVLLKGSHINRRTAENIRESIELPFAALRTDSTEVEYTHETAQTSEGKSFQYTDDVRDKKTGLPVLEVIVDSIRGTAPGQATLHLYEADNAGVHYQGLKWWMTKRDGKWVADSVRTLWIN